MNLTETLTLTVGVEVCRAVFLQEFFSVVMIFTLNLLTFYVLKKIQDSRWILRSSHILFFCLQAPTGDLAYLPETWMGVSNFK